MQPERASHRPDRLRCPELRATGRLSLNVTVFPSKPGRSFRLATRATGFAISAAITLLSANTKAEPTPRAETALLHDLEKIVESKANSGWKIDRYELDAMMPDALQSVCATEEETRQHAQERQEKTVEALGGPIAEAYQKNGEKLSELKDLLAATRVLSLLEEAIRRAPTECPFWIKPSSSFIGIQTDADRFTLNLETGGLLLIRASLGKFLPGGGGLGRLLIGRGLSEHWSLLFGLEVGGWALFEQSQTQTRFPIEIIGGAPVVIRRVQHTWHYDLEIAPAVFLAANDLRPSPGGRLGMAIGVSTLRIRGIMPWAGVQLSAEMFPETSYRPTITVLKGGARVGFDWDF